jgi:hypothetical protein
MQCIYGTYEGVKRDASERRTNVRLHAYGQLQSMTTFERKYSDDEREAAVFAYVDRNIRPAKAVLDLAARGELITRDGRKVRPYEINPYTLKTWIQHTRRKRRGRVPGAAHEDPEGTIEALRKRLIALADGELAYLERQRTGKRDPEHMRQIARAVREAAAIPVKGEPRGRAPGERDANGKQPDQHTRGGMAGALLKAHRSKPAPGPLSTQETQAENTSTSATARSDDTKARESGSPNSDSETQDSVLEPSV